MTTNLKLEQKKGNKIKMSTIFFLDNSIVGGGGFEQWTSSSKTPIELGKRVHFLFGRSGIFNENM